MPDLLEGFADFCGRLAIPSKEQGLTPLAPLYGTQTYFMQEIATALEEDVHDVVVLKGRQQGVTTMCDALDLYYLQTHPGMIGMLVSDEDTNRDFRRDVLRQMLDSLPKSHRFPVRLDNTGALAWAKPNESRLLFAAAGKRDGKGKGSKTRLGRSKGLNYLHADEVGTWPDDKAVSALQASLAEHHPARLYLWASTAQGFGVFKDLWDTATKAVTQRAVFIGWWRHDLYRVKKGSAIWKRYAGEPTPTERAWMRAIRNEYDVELTPEQVVWRRWQFVEKFRGDERMLMQEHPNVPEEAFQAFGDTFIPEGTITRLRRGLKTWPKAKGYRYEWGPYLDNTAVKDAGPRNAPLVIYEEPDPNAVYVVAAHPWGSSSPQARAHVCQVWRAWPDKLRLVAEFYDEAESMYHFAWACLHLTAAYKTWSPVYFILEIGMSGAHVLTEIDRISNLSYGLSPEARANNVTSFIESIQYLYRRADSFGASVLRQVKSTAEIRARLLYGLRDEVEREHVEIGNPALIDELASLRRGEAGDADEIEGGGDAPEARAITAGMAVLAWLEQAMPDLLAYIPPKEETGGPRHVGEAVVGAMLARVMRRG